MTKKRLKNTNLSKLQRPNPGTPVGCFCAREKASSADYRAHFEGSLSVWARLNYIDAHAIDVGIDEKLDHVLLQRSGPAHKDTIAVWILETLRTS